MSVIRKFRKRPVMIEAMQIARYPGDNAQEVADWCGGRSVWGTPIDGEATPAVLIRTLEGVMTASAGDFVIRGVQGEFYPCKPDIFEATYEEMK